MSIEILSRVHTNILTYIKDVRGYSVTNDIDLKIEMSSGFGIIRASRGSLTLAFVLIIDNRYISRYSDFAGILKNVKNVNELIIVSESIIKQGTMATILRNNPKINMRGLDFSYFVFDPRKHAMVPAHSIVENEDSIMIECNIANKLQLPMIKFNDKQVVWVNGQVGNIIKINRIDDNGHSVNYRVVV